MRRRVLLLSVPLIALVAWEVPRALFAFWMWKGHYALLERWGGDSYFIPAVRRLHRPGGRDGCYDRELAEWATRRYQSRFPGEIVLDVAWLPPHQLVLLRHQAMPEGPFLHDESRATIVVLDVDRGEQLVAQSGLIQDLEVCDFDIRYFPGWEGPIFKVNGLGSGENSILLRRCGNSFTEYRRKNIDGKDEPFHSWGPMTLVDIDGDGIPEVRTWLGKWTHCPHCGREDEANLVTWKLVGCSFRKWTERAESCGLNCELAWSN